MALSMTGFGAAEGDVAGRRARVEIRTVNHRWFNLATRVPAECGPLEAELREAVRRDFERGHVNVNVRWIDDGLAAEGIDFDRAGVVVEALRALQQRFGLSGDVSVELVARQADVLGLRRSDEMPPPPWADLEPVVRDAARACRAAREREGTVLATELRSRFDAIDAGLDAVSVRAPERLVRERERLQTNVAALLNGATVDDARIAQELAVTADRLDITEELLRFRAHLTEARNALDRGGPVGKQLGFLAQEMGREANTLGAKANDSVIAHAVVAMKSELEKVREQLENLE